MRTCKCCGRRRRCQPLPDAIPGDKTVVYCAECIDLIAAHRRPRLRVLHA